MLFSCYFCVCWMLNDCHKPKQTHLHQLGYKLQPKKSCLCLFFCLNTIGYFLGFSFVFDLIFMQCVIYPSEKSKKEICWHSKEPAKRKNEELLNVQWLNTYIFMELPIKHLFSHTHFCFSSFLFFARFMFGLGLWR